MVPHTNSSKPQSTNCKDCPRNQWASADTGKGKACKNIRRLAVIPEGAMKSAEKILEADVWYLKLAVTSGKLWSAYVKKLAATLGIPPFAAVTKLEMQPDPKSTFKIIPSYVSKAESGEQFEALIKKHESEHDPIRTPYTYQLDVPTAVPASNKKAKFSKTKK